MHKLLSFDLLLTSHEMDDLAARAKIDISCVYGVPAAMPTSDSEIPFTIKEMLLNGHVCDFHERQVLLKVFGGVERVKEILFQSDLTGGVA